MHKFTKALAAIGLAAVMSQSAMAENLKLGFLVKQPEEPWFQTEWKFADKAGKDLGFEVIKIAVPDGEKTLNAIDSLAASGAKGFVICTPDPKLGSAIVAKARGYDMKVIAVDDQFVNAKGKPMDTVPLVMMAATKIGERQGQELYKEMQKRGWDVKESAVMAITANELDTARRRTTGSIPAQPQLMLDMEQARGLLHRQDASLVSIRSWPEFIGTTSGYSYIKPKGEIAGARWGHAGSDSTHMEDFHNPDGTMRSADDITAMWKAWNIKPEQQVSFYCGTGWRASETFMYARAMGWKNVSVYDGGWYEWSSDPKNPVATGERGPDSSK